MRARHNTAFRAGDSVWYRTSTKGDAPEYAAVVQATPRKKGRHWVVRLRITDEDYPVFFENVYLSRIHDAARCSRMRAR